jgi:glyoxylase-like metal-dependent hydrolase (beta-lactamase superfamily II)
MNAQATVEATASAPPTERLSRYGIVNSYLVRDRDGLTAIDTGLPGLHRAIVARAARLELPLTRVVLTHAHSDHTGSLAAIVEKTPGIELIISAREEPLLHGDRALRDGKPATRVRGQFPPVKVRVAATVDDSDRIGPLAVISTPGHTPGHISLLDTRDGTLYCGDVFSNIGGLTASAMVNPRFPLAGMFTWNRDLALTSAERLLELRPACLAPGHGKPIDSPAAPMRKAINKATRRRP